MSADIKTLRTRIKSVSSTQQLTRAMGLVASSKIRKATQRMLHGRDYAAALTQVLAALTAHRLEPKRLQAVQKRADTAPWLFLLEAKRCADFLNESFYIMEAALEMGDYYYNIPGSERSCLQEYFQALKAADHVGVNVDTSKIIARIKDMKIRMSPEDFAEIEERYDR